MRRIKLYVGNIPYSATEQLLRDVFVEQGFQPVSVKVITDRETGQPRGFAFVELADANHARQSIDKLNGSAVGGRTIVVNEAREPQRGGRGGGSGASGGRYGGRNAHEA